MKSRAFTLITIAAILASTFLLVSIHLNGSTNHNTNGMLG